MSWCNAEQFSRGNDYKHTFIPLHGTHNIDGLGKGLRIAGKGMVTWTFKAEDGSYRDMMIPCYYVPSCHARILSTQTFLRYYPKETISMNNRNLPLSGDEYNQPITVPYCPASHLPVAPIVMTARVRTDKDDTPSLHHKQHQRPHPSLTVDSNINLSEPEREILKWHQRLGHISVKRIQWMMRQGLLSSSERTRRLHQAAAKLTHGPMCTACQYAAKSKADFRTNKLKFSNLT